MSMSFHAKTVTWLALSSTLLGAGLYASLSGQRALVFAQTQAQTLAGARQQVAQNRERTEIYASLIERIGWRPGQALRHETIDTTAMIAGHESDRLNDILQANHVGKGQFFLRSLTIETVRGGQAREAALKVSIKGDNILVLDRP